MPGGTTKDQSAGSIQSYLQSAVGCACMFLHFYVDAAGSWPSQVNVGVEAVYATAECLQEGSTIARLTYASPSSAGTWGQCSVGSKRAAREPTSCSQPCPVKPYIMLALTHVCMQNAPWLTLLVGLCYSISLDVPR